MSPPARARLLAILGLLLGVALLYGRTLGYGFVDYDDGDYVYRNEVVLRGLGPDGVRWAFTAFHAANWHPLTWLSHMLDVELFGRDAGGHHLTNVLLHGLNAVLVLSLFLRTTRAFWPSVAVAALFAFHPLRVESVAWVAERKDLLAAAFGLGALHAWTSFARRGGAGRYLAALLLLAAGLMSKPMLVTWPCVLLLFDVWPLGRWRGVGGELGLGRLCLEKLPFALLVVGSVLVTLRAQDQAAAITWLDRLSLDVRVANALHAYGLFVVRHFVPLGLAVFYPHPASLPGVAPPHLGPLELGLGALLVASVAGVLLARRRAPWLLFGWLWFLGTLVPVIGLVQVGGHELADRYAYLPLLGLHVAVVWSAARLATTPAAQRVAAAGLLLWLLGGAAVAWRLVGTWRDSVTLFERALAVTDDNFLAHYNLATALMERGEFARAEEHYRATVALRRDHADAWNGLGLSLVRQGRGAEAEPAFRAALRARPGDADALVNLAAVALARGDLDLAGRELERALASRPDHAAGLRSLGVVRYRQRRRAEAVRALARAFTLAPADANHADLYAWLLATSPEAELRDGAEAVRWAEHARSLAPGNPKHLDTLAAAEAERGRFDAAARAQEAALPGMPPALRAGGEARLALYRAGRPYRSSSGSER